MLEEITLLIPELFVLHNACIPSGQGPPSCGDALARDTCCSRVMFLPRMKNMFVGRQNFFSFILATFYYQGFMGSFLSTLSSLLSPTTKTANAQRDMALR